MITSRICLLCKEIKPLESFYKKANGFMGRGSRCNTCERKRSKEHATAYPEKRKALINAYHSKPENKHKSWVSHIQRTYGLTETQYSELEKAQNYCCAICKNPSKKKLCVDHDHSTNEVRGLLCTDCNKAIGQLGDTADGLRKALAYLEKSST